MMIYQFQLLKQFFESFMNVCALTCYWFKKKIIFYEIFYTSSLICYLEKYRTKVNLAWFIRQVRKNPIQRAGYKLLLTTAVSIIWKKAESLLVKYRKTTLSKNNSSQVFWMDESVLLKPLIASKLHAPSMYVLFWGVLLNLSFTSQKCT